ncbi:hypothetical protein NMY22_g4895 [Coprinellus aureogranulatus]|nr:hypothetical protein NMY22_g4895 [Coprinellus aureogranulatus]
MFLGEFAVNTAPPKTSDVLKCAYYYLQNAPTELAAPSILLYSSALSQESDMSDHIRSEPEGELTSKCCRRDVQSPGTARSLLMDPSNFIETIETSPSVGQHFPTGGSFYTGAHGFRIDKQTNVVNTYAEPNDLLSVLNPIPDASFARDRTLSPPDSNCLPGTRQALIKNIQSWLDSSTLRGLQHVMWIYGYVGCGKSSISQTLAEKYAP